MEHVADRLVGARAPNERRRLGVLDELRLAPLHEPAARLRLRFTGTSQQTRWHVYLCNMISARRVKVYEMLCTMY